MRRLSVKVSAAAALLFAFGIGQALAQGACANRGELDARYCDEDGDLIADPPKDAKELQDPSTLIFSYTPVEDPAVYENVWSDFMQHLAKATGKRVRWFPAESYAAQVEAMRSGRLHIAGVATGPTPYAVNLAGFEPLVGMAQKKGGGFGYTLQLITRADSPIKSLADLKGKRVAHVSPSSNSGHIAPQALFTAQGITPGKDYQILFSGKHDNSIMGVVNGDYDAAPVASSVVDRMAARNMFKKEQLRTVYESGQFPRTAYGVAHNLTPGLKAKIREAFLTFPFKGSKLGADFKDIERFAPINYKEHWKEVRLIQKATGVSYNQESLSKLGRKGD